MLWYDFGAYEAEIFLFLALPLHRKDEEGFPAVLILMEKLYQPTICAHC